MYCAYLYKYYFSQYSLGLIVHVYNVIQIQAHIVFFIYELYSEGVHTLLIHKNGLKLQCVQITIISRLEYCEIYTDLGVERKEEKKISVETRKTVLKKKKKTIS